MSEFRQRGSVIGWTLVLLCASGAFRQTVAESSKKAVAEAAHPQEASEVSKGREALEEKFAQMMTDVTLKGSWQMTMGDGIERPVSLTNPSPDSYKVLKVEHTTGDHWVITARIRYADKDVELPVMVRVLWSGDTPIITVDNLTMPVLGTYSARVMIYKGLYAGTWFGSGYGGVMSGQIVKSAKSDATSESASNEQGESSDAVGGPSKSGD